MVVVLAVVLLENYVMDESIAILLLISLRMLVDLQPDLTSHFEDG